MTSCSNKGAILSFVVYNFITAKICSVYSAFHRRHYGGKKANDNDNDSDNDNDITKYHHLARTALQPNYLLQCTLTLI